MESLRAAIANAIARKRVPLHVADVPIRITNVGASVGLRRPLSVNALLQLLEVPGNFRPGQVLATSAELGFGHDVSFQSDVFAVGIDTSVWKFWEYNDGVWLNGVVGGIGVVPPSAPVVAQGSGRYTLDNRIVVIQLFAPSISESGIAVFNQDPGGKWQPLLLPVGGSLSVGAQLTPMIGEGFNALVAVDNSGRLTYFHQTTESPTTFGALAATPISEAGFAPPGAPVAVDVRVVALNDGAPLNVFVVSNAGELWSFELDNFGTTWTPIRMPNPSGIKLLAGSFIATGYQVAFEQQGAGSHSLGYSQLDVFVIDAQGSLQMWWESQGSGWTQQAVKPAARLLPGAPLITARQVFDIPYQDAVIGNQLDVFSVDAQGRLQRWWVYQSGGWSQDVIPAPQPLPPGAHLAAGYQGRDDKGRFHQTDVFVVGHDGRIAMFSQWDENAWAYQVIPGSDAPVPPTTM